MRPPAILSAPQARLAVYVAFAGLGAVQWDRFVAGGSPWRATAWVLAGLLAGALVSRARTRRGLAGALVAGAASSLLLSGIDLARLAPGRWDEIPAGLTGAVQALSTVRLPYGGADPWVATVVALSGAGLCWLAAVLAAWPGAGWPRTLALASLLVLAATPVVSLGTHHATLVGAALTVLVVAFLRLERVARRGIAGLVVLAGLAILAALPLAGAADRDLPWFDYQAFSERLAAGRPLHFDWTQRYGPIDWPREGAEVLRVRASTARPLYLKTEELGDFDGRGWDQGHGLGDEAGELARDWRAHPEWDVRLGVTVRRMRTPTLPTPGTTLSVRSATRPVAPDVLPGPWTVRGAGALGAGDSYVLTAHVPAPTAAQLAGATVDRDDPGDRGLAMQLPLPAAARRVAPAGPKTPGRPRLTPDAARVQFPAWSVRRGPTALFRDLGTAAAAGPLLARSGYRRTWALAQRLKARSATPYDDVLQVSQALKRPGFRYTETPPAAAPGVPPLDAFLFDSRAGYCQQYAGAMALLLRMSGIPARVVTGFSPGGRRGTTGEWVVRDTDAHAWVEAWFDGYGWVTLDPTPPDTPARTLTAVGTPTPAPTAAPVTDTAAGRPAARRPEGISPDRAAPAPSTPAGRDGTSWAPLLAIALTAALAAGLVLLLLRAVAARPRDEAQRRLLEVERAMRLSGRSVEPATTLTALERRLAAGGEAAAYLRAVRATRFAGGAQTGPTAAQRAAFRRELGAGLGPVGHARAWLAVPPRPVRLPSRPR